MAIHENFLCEICGVAKVSNPWKFSSWKLYFSLIRESFLPWKFPAIHYISQVFLMVYGQDATIQQTKWAILTIFDSVCNCLLHGVKWHRLVGERVSAGGQTQRVTCILLVAWECIEIPVHITVNIHKELCSSLICGYQCVVYHMQWVACMKLDSTIDREIFGVKIFSLVA